tara:strand:+ start:2939 stop:3271 length:333 start_codon:yes stop_codon:yes gene_type:complete
MSNYLNGYNTTLPNGKTAWVPPQTNILTETRQRYNTRLYCNETYTPGSNNGYTKGRRCDQYDRNYNGYNDNHDDGKNDDYYSESDSDYYSDDDSDYYSDNNDSDWEPDNY